MIARKSFIVQQKKYTIENQWVIYNILYYMYSYFLLTKVKRVNQSKIMCLNMFNKSQNYLGYSSCLG